MVTAEKRKPAKTIGNLVAKAYAVRGVFYSVIANRRQHHRGGPSLQNWDGARRVFAGPGWGGGWYRSDQLQCVLT